MKLDITMDKRHNEIVRIFEHLLVRGEIIEGNKKNSTKDNSKSKGIRVN